MCRKVMVHDHMGEAISYGISSFSLNTYIGMVFSKIISKKKV